LVGETTKKVLAFKKKYPETIVFRIKKHAGVIDKFLNPGERVIYAFPGQKNEDWYNILNTCVVAITSKRIMIATKRVWPGYFLTSITPDMFNDLNVFSGFFFGKITIDTIKEVITISSISKKALDEIETEITEYLLREKKKYLQNHNEKKKVK